MTTAETYRRLFAEWPADVNRRGIVVSNLNEAIPFKGFMIGESMLLLERSNPDSLGARFIAMSYDEIAKLKYTDPLKSKAFEAMGFLGKLSQ